MAVRRRGRPAPKAGPGAGAAPKVHAVTTLEQWQALLHKATSSRRALAVQFFHAQNFGCMQMRPYFRRMSTDGPLKAAIFAEIDVEAAEDALLAACGVRSGVTRLPYYAVYVDGEVAEEYSGGVPAQVAQMVQRQVAALRGSGPSLLTKLLAAAAGMAALGGAALWWRAHHGGGGGPGDLGSELRSVSERMTIAQRRLQNCERAGRLKAAKAQRRILDRLEAQRQRLEEQLARRESGAAGGGARRKAKAARGGSGSSAAAGGGGSSGGGAEGGGGGVKQRRSAPWIFDDEGEPGYGRPAVLYSDEEY